MKEKIRTDAHVAEVWIAKRKIVSLASDWLTAIRKNQQARAVEIRKKINGIKRDIKTKYNVILDS